MALMKCAECSREISDKTLACPGCGAPTTLESACPSCKSGDCKKVSLIHQEGVTTMLGAGIGAGGNVAVAGGTSKTELAKRTAPPRPIALIRKGQSLAMFCAVILGVSVLFTFNIAKDQGGVGGFGVVWLLFWTALTAWRFKKMMGNPLPIDHARIEYEKTFMCLRCGTFYKPFG